MLLQNRMKDRISKKFVNYVNFNCEAFLLTLPFSRPHMLNEIIYSWNLNFMRTRDLMGTLVDRVTVINVDNSGWF